MSRLSYIEVRGFRAFGAQPRRLDFTNDIVVVHAPNSQGKTSLFEAIEFLLTGSTSRRALLGSAAAEFEGSLRNVHIGPSSEVSVTAGVVSNVGRVHVVRRVLDQDCTGQRDCESTLTVDGIEHDDLPAELEIELSAPPLAAPVMFQHTLRYVMSAKPQERVQYFKRIFELEVLDEFRGAVAQLRAEQADPRTPRLDALAQSTRGAPLRARLLETAGDVGGARQTLREALAALDPTLADATADTAELGLDDLAERARQVLDRRRKARSPAPLFELTPDAMLTARQRLPDLDRETITSYAETINQVDQAHARLVPLFERALTLPELSEVQEGVSLDCPLCLTPHALTYNRIEQIRAELLGLTRVTDQARAAGEALAQERERVRTLWRHAAAVPVALDEQGRADLEQRLAALGHGPEAAAEPLAAASRVQQAGRQLRAEAEAYGGLLSAKMQDIAEHRGLDPQEILGAALKFRSVVTSWQREVGALAQRTAEWSHQVATEIDSSLGLAGWAEVIDAADNASLIESELAADVARRRVLAKLNTALNDIDAGIRAVLDERFDAMSEAINRWWLTLRPEEELVGFSGMRRRGAGRRFLDIKAALRPRVGEEAVERDAVAIGSDSQLNALGLASFLARTGLSGSGWVALDDAVPGSDVEHRSTFVSNTIPALQADGLQVLVATHDSELARMVVDLHRHLGVDQFELALDDGHLGPTITKVSDRFEERLAAGKGLSRSGLAEHRRQAAGDLRQAAEILAKAIVAAARREEGGSPDVRDLDGKSLAQLVDRVLPYVVMSEEPGYWNTLRRLLNPGAHDDPKVPSPNDLTTAAGFLHAIHREHKARQPGFRTD